MTNGKDYMRDYMRKYNEKHREDVNAASKARYRAMAKSAIAFEGLMAWLEANGYEEAVRKGRELAGSELVVAGLSVAELAS